MFVFVVFFSSAVLAQGFSTVEKGTVNTDSYRVYFEDNGKPISPFHDIPLKAGAGGL